MKNDVSNVTCEFDRNPLTERFLVIFQTIRKLLKRSSNFKIHRAETRKGWSLIVVLNMKKGVFNMICVFGLHRLTRSFLENFETFIVIFYAQIIVSQSKLQKFVISKLE